MRRVGTSRVVCFVALLCLFIGPGCTQERAPQTEVTSVLFPHQDERLFIGTKYDFVFHVPNAIGAEVTSDGEKLFCRLNNARGHLHCPVTAKKENVRFKITARTGEKPSDTSSSEIEWVFHVAKGHYPRGDKYVMGLYSVNDDRLADVAADGFNMVHTYGITTEEQQMARLSNVKEAGLHSMTAVNWIDEKDEQGFPKSETLTKDYFDRLAESETLEWWYLPEELRADHADEFFTFKKLSGLIREVDEWKRPVFMYIAGNYTAKDLTHFIPYLDIVGTGAYTEYSNQPHSWVRWRIRSQIQAIEDCGYTVETKTPIAVLGIFPHDEPSQPQVSPEGFYHDVFSGIAAGARSVLTFSYFYGQRLPEALAALRNATTLVTGEEAIGEWVLHGKQEGDLPVTVTDGPLVTPPFVPDRTIPPIVYPSVRAVSWYRAGVKLIIAVNSSTEPVTARIDGLKNDSVAVVLDENRALHAREGSLTDTFKPLGVHIYKVKEAGF